MAVKYINENAKVESGVLLSGYDARKVFSMFGENKSSKIEKLKFLLDKVLEKPFPSAS